MSKKKTKKKIKIPKPPYTSKNYKAVLKAYDAGLIHPEINPYVMFADELSDDAVLDGLRGNRKKS